VTETWRSIPGHDGRYVVSDQGRVASARGVLSPGLHNGYPFVTLTAPRRTYRVHTLVLLAFVGPPPEGCECCHEDGDRANNRLTNLRWDTRQANILDEVAHGTHHNARKTHCSKGHEFSPENTGQRKDGGRYCRACLRRAA
jgi:hypothetical protein